MRLAFGYNARLRLLSHQAGPFRPVLCSHPPSITQPCPPISSTRRFWTSPTTPASPSNISHNVAPRGATKSPNPSEPLTWVAQLDRYLPSRLRVNPGEGIIQQNADLATILRISHDAQSQAKVTLWLWMVNNGRKKAAVALIHSLLHHVSQQMKTKPDEIISNIPWQQSFRMLDVGAFDVDRPQSSNLRNSKVSLLSDVDRPQLYNKDVSAFMSNLWRTLATAVLEASAAQHVSSDEHMSFVLLVLGMLHNLGMVPDHLYTLKEMHLSSHTQRPPILHLVSSRILTAMSDAAWREQQDDAIAQATDLGMSLNEISKSVPGGRFRLQVRPLPAEIWLELILWCCVDGDHHVAATSIINMLHSQADNPWYAIRWCATSSTHTDYNLVDWDRVRLRHGGPVGLIEGYSRETPFVDAPKNTVSVEVVLTLVERLLDMDFVDEKGQFNLPAFRQIRRITGLIAFLEPHDLVPSYFDYLETRLMHIATLAATEAPRQFQKWSEQVAKLRKFKSIRQSENTTQSLELDYILDHSLLQIAARQQVLDAHMQAGSVHAMLSIFNDIQELVDQNKVNSIAEFLQPDDVSMRAFFTSRAHKYRLEYAESLGQLPFFKLAAFLDAITNANLIGLGQWLLSADSLDVPLIPQSAYGLTCMAPSLLRFAGVSKDTSLFHDVQRALNRNMKPTIRILRARVDAHIILLQDSSARSQLNKLKIAQGGGYSLSNVMHLAACVLRLENPPSRSQIRVEGQHARMLALLDGLLAGQYDCIRGDYTLLQNVDHKQNMSQALRLFAYCDGSSLQDLARKHCLRFVSGNRISFPAKNLNTFLAAFAETFGCVKTKALWDSFIQGPINPQTLQEITADEIDHREDVVQSSILPEALVSVSNISNESDPTFSNHFFPNDATKPSEHVSFDADEDNFHKHQRLIMSAELSAYLEPLPIAMADVTSLRVIAQAAINDRDDLSSRGQMHNSPVEILHWAAQMFSRLGVRDADHLSQEVRMDVGELDISRPFAKKQQTHTYQETETSRLWTPPRHLIRRPLQSVIERQGQNEGEEVVSLV